MNEHAIVTEILRKEGGDKYTNYPNDRGGPTKWGITLVAWSGYIGHAATPEDVKAIDETQARNFYFSEYISQPKFDHIDDEFLAEFIIDCGVNHGPRRASKWLQEAAGVVVDGAIGPKTIAAVNQQHPHKLFLLTVSMRIKFYALISSDQLPADPDLPNLKGWMNRATSFIIAAAQEIK